ncbi:MAG: hypothetical protein RL757_2404 [Bacteroidota bacterium]|jgi:hypothetical protein
MKKIFTACCLALSLGASAQTTPTLDGVFDGAAVWGAPIATADGTAGWQGVNVGAIYATFDANYVYLGATVTGAQDWMDWGFAINSQAGGGTAEVWARAVTYAHTDLPDLVVKGHFGDGGAGYSELRIWDGAAWVQSPNAGNFGENEAAFVEVRIPVSKIPGGENPAGKVQFYVCGNNSSNGIFDACPNESNVTNWGQSSTITNYVANVYLPVELTKFSATANAANINLAWETASEKNNNRFEIERSNDGSNWAKIGEVKGLNANGAQKYQFTDATAARGTNYYRLRQVDNSGKTTLSKVVSAALGVKGTFSVSPNPVSATLTVDTDLENAEISILDLSGRLMKTTQNQANIDVSDLAAGTYFVRVTRAGEVSQVRFVKQ